MAIEPYRRLLALPGVRTLLLVGLVARIPSTAMGITLTLHIRSLGLGWLAAGAVGAVTTVGMAVGSPLAGRFVDRHGLRPVLMVTTVAQLAFWSCAWALPYPVLLVASVVAGLLALPVFSVIRQCLAALVPVEQRRIGFSLDSIMVELSYMAGPALGVMGITVLGSAWTMSIVAVGLTCSGAALILLNPPTRSAEELEAPAEKVLRRQWLTPGLIALLGTASAATFVLTASELSLVATMEHAGDTAWTGLAIGLWCAYSLVGGFVYGGLPRGFSPLVLVGGMGALTIPVGLVGGDWRWLLVALLPAGLLCAPGLSSTVETLSRWIPAGARGEAMGLHGTALLIGGALSAPIAGAVIDGAGPGWAFALAGLVGAGMVLVALPFWRRVPAPAEQPVTAAV
ncbi:MFS transporter [Streptosporangium canum]|uniref:MFS transporter n=1 Tax=Streptosporangium canum TaxID=324952 RepID=UPI0033B580A3